ncbi:MAG: glycosyltransferase involved in cell wall biosynthesis [Oleiphilaceae bacterium]|jgi:glycosyltransferase involved in cell wall biosynthesis
MFKRGRYSFVDTFELRNYMKGEPRLGDSMNNGLVSVVVPSYNYASYLEKRIESILNQTYPNIEIIVIDDYSHDNSVEVLQKYASHPNIRLVCKDKNEGWISTNNQGAELALGEYVLFAQCDDVCDPTMVERLVESMQQHPSAGVSFCRSLLVDREGNSLDEDYDGRDVDFKEACKEDVLLSKHQMALFLLNACVIPNLSALLIKKECFETIGSFSHDYKVCSDWDWYFRVVERYDVAYIASPLNHFMQHDATIRSSTKDKIIFEEYFRLLLSNIKKIDLSLIERFKVRWRAAGLWSEHLIAPSWAGIVNFPYHLTKVAALDLLTIALLPIALIHRLGSVLMKLPSKLVKK